MFTLLLVIAFCGKLVLSNSYLQHFNKVELHPQSGYGLIISQPFSPHSAIYRKDICDANDEETMSTNIPEQACAEECFNAPYFCNSFSLGFQNDKLKCFHYAIKATSIPVLEVSYSQGVSDSSVWLHSLYEIKREPDFVTTVAELSTKLINHRLNNDDWQDIVKEYYINPQWYDFKYVMRFGQSCKLALLYQRIIDSMSEKQTLRLGSLDRKSFILALKMFHSSNPEYSPDFDKLALIFLKWFQSRYCDFSDTHYMAMDREVGNTIFVHTFSSGHYVTITRGIDRRDHITYISADGSFDQKDSNIKAAISKYLQSTDSLLGLTEGTTELSRDPGEEYVDDIDLSHLGSTKAERMQQTAIAVVGHLANAFEDWRHVEFKNPLDATLVRDLITLVLSWAYKVRQSDFDQIEILNRASKIRTVFTGFSRDSILDIITQH